MKENVAGAEIKNEEIIHPLESPISPVGGLSILYGNIAQDGAVIKVGGVDPSVKTFRGKAICCDSQDEALELIDNGTVKKVMLSLFVTKDLKVVQVCQKCLRQPLKSSDVDLVKM